MNGRAVRIMFEELPPRPRVLTEGQIAAVFGGCDAPGTAGPATCDTQCSNCCEPYRCIYKGTAPYGSYFCATA